LFGVLGFSLMQCAIYNNVQLSPERRSGGLSRAEIRQRAALPFSPSFPAALAVSRPWSMRLQRHLSHAWWAATGDRIQSLYYHPHSRSAHLQSNPLLFIRHTINAAEPRNARSSQRLNRAKATSTSLKERGKLPESTLTFPPPWQGSSLVVLKVGSRDYEV
jgi:hypothetical protein